MSLLTLPLLIVSLLFSSPVHNYRLTNYENSVLPSCGQFFNTTSCYYFSCLDAIYQCGIDNALVQFLYPLCEATTDRLFSSFTPNAQSWALSTRICLLQEVHNFFQSNSPMTCSKIDQFIMNQAPTCLTQSHSQHSLCSIMCENLAVFLKLFDGWDLKSINLRRFFLETIALCPEQPHVTRVIDVSKASVRTILWSICLDSADGKIGGLQPEQLMVRVDPDPGIFSQVEDG